MEFSTRFILIGMLTAWTLLLFACNHDIDQTVKTMKSEIDHTYADLRELRAVNHQLGIKVDQLEAEAELLATEVKYLTAILQERSSRCLDEKN